ncbi:unannotated protein [freshwater metagenome]|uniref:Unannotated protein n=1 Tax=freshwater metagenome TaxID=449393 RepID=A0A6J6GCU4_9ZZZZ
MIRIPIITAVIGIMSAKDANPKAGSSAIRICSLPYADDEMQSLERIPSAYLLLKRW